MRETKFIEQNRQKWETLEQLMESPAQDPDKLNELFVQVTDDLSFSRTFYPNRSVRVYLNSLAQKIFDSIYTTRKVERSKFLTFWTLTLPRLVYESRREFRVSLAVFVLSLLIGIVSSTMDPDFVRHVLGDDYVDMTLKNIHSGDPMAVYKDRGAFGMWLGITANNIWVAFLTFVTGVLYMVGTLWVLIQNGVMIGAFQYFFVQQGLFRESFLTIWMHGTLEISAIIIAGAAGLTLGRGLVFPGTYSRLRAFQQSARRGLSIMLGITPVFIFAGFIEGYFTRYTDAPDALRLVFILACLAFVLSYFVWYPVRLARRGRFDHSNVAAGTPERVREIEFGELKSLAQIFQEVFLFFKMHPKPLFLSTFLAAALWCAVFFAAGRAPVQEMLYFSWEPFAIFSHLNHFFFNNNFTYLPLLNGFTYGVVALVTCHLLAREAVFPLREKLPPAAWIFDYLKMVTGSIGLCVIIGVWGEWTFLLLLTVFPILLVWKYAMIAERRGLTNSFGRTLTLASSATWRVFGLNLVLLITGLFFLLFLDTAVFTILLEAIGMNLELSENGAKAFTTILTTFAAVWLLKFMMALMLIGMGLLFHTLVEIHEANGLKDRIRTLGSQRRIRGMEWEGTNSNDF